MEAHCIDCDNHFVVGPGEAVSGACPHCGGKRLERDQPSPLHSDGELRNMVDPSTGIDQGGNPLMEGIWGSIDNGWRQRGVRDESFAKVAAPGDKTLWAIAHYVLHQHTLLSPQDAMKAAQMVEHEAQAAGLQVTQQQVIDALKLAHSVLYGGEADARTRDPRLHKQYEDDTSAWHPQDDLQDPNPLYLHQPIAPVPSDLQARLPRQPNYGTTMHNERTSNMDPYPTLWDDDFMEKTAGPLLALPAAGEALGLGGALPFLMRGALMGTGNNMIKGLFGGGDNQQAGPQQSVPPPQPRDLSQISHVAAGEDGSIPVETPTSNPGYTHDNPERVDQQEFSDESTSPAQQNPNTSVEGGGLTDVSNPGDEKAGVGADKPTFAADGPGMQRAQLLAPLLQHYHNSPESGANDPMIRELHELLEQESPGYIDKVGPEHAHEFERWQAEQRQPQGIHAHTAANPFAGPAEVIPSTEADPQILAHVQPRIQELIAKFGMSPENATRYALTEATGQAYAKTADWGMVPEGRDTNPVGPHYAPGVGMTPGAAPVMQPGGGLPGVGQQGMCPYCGGMQAADGTCPQCGAKAPPGGAQQSTMPQQQSVPPGGYRAKVAADSQGPVTQEQQAAVADLLVQSGREKEVPVMIQQPWLYSDELAQITGQANVPTNLPPGAQPTPPPAPPMGMDPSAMGAGALPPGGMPPGMPSPMGHVAADNIAKRCPVCNSATTGLLNNDGDCHCHACGMVWQPNDTVKEKVAAGGEPDSSNVVDVPAADQHDPRDVEQEQDTSLQWQDDQGQQLIPGQQYEMHSANYMVPDLVRVDQVKPDEIVVTTIGMQDPKNPDAPQSGYQHTVSKQTADMYGTTFKPIEGNDSEAGDQSLQQYQDQGQAPVHTEPTAVASSVKQADFEETVQQLSVYNDGVNGFGQGDRDAAEEINQHGDFRIGDQWFDGGDGDPQPREASSDQCPVCTSTHIASAMASPEKVGYDCFKCGHYWESAAESYESDADLASREWLKSGGDSDDFFENMERMQAMAAAQRGTQSRDIRAIASKDPRNAAIKERLDANKMAREAGRKFSPSEQRGFIEERGMARNSDLLDLEDTHYKFKDEWDASGNAANAPDEHLLFGM